MVRVNGGSFVLWGDICYSLNPHRLCGVKDGYLVCRDGVCAGVFDQLPTQYADLPVIDRRGRLVIPGLVDLHIHAPQYAFRGLGMDLELLDWLDTNTFPEEARYRDLDYAVRAYDIFAEDLRWGPNTRACIFASAHTDATLLLMDRMEATGLVSLVGRVNMDRNCPENLREPDPDTAAAETVRWLEQAAGRYQRTGPILTPRFIPSCTDALLSRLGEIRKEYDLCVQSHLSENRGEVEWVGQLCPDAPFYGAAYDSFGLFGGEHRCIMAHCVLSEEEELDLMKQRGVFVAHCPQSNENLASGIAPVRRYLEQGLQVGLGSDVAGGTTPSIFRAMADAIQVSKLRWRLQDQSLAPLTLPEAFWLGTAGGGAFFGQVGRFAPGYELDALVLDDSRLRSPWPLTVEQRLERMVYLGEDRDITDKFVRGVEIFSRPAGKPLHPGP